MKLISKRLTVAAVAGAAILPPPMALAATSRGAAPQQSAVTAPACVNAQPALPGGTFVWAGLPGDGFAGGMGYVAEITNEGRHACSLRGAPGAAVQDSNGSPVRQQASGVGQRPARDPEARRDRVLLLDHS
jgi:Protein of unknown function (DUF4232)